MNRKNSFLVPIAPVACAHRMLQLLRAEGIQPALAGLYQKTAVGQ
jgi:hypothetical protein